MELVNWILENRTELESVLFECFMALSGAVMVLRKIANAADKLADKTEAKWDDRAVGFVLGVAKALETLVKIIQPITMRGRAKR